MPGVGLAQVQDFACDPAEPTEVSMAQLSGLSRSQSGIVSLQHRGCTTEPGSAGCFVFKELCLQTPYRFNFPKIVRI